VEFEWDDFKADANLKKHGIRFTEAATIWLDEFALEIPDTDHSKDEERWVRMGMSRQARILIVVYVERIEGERIRIISARRADSKERKQYESR